MDGVPVRPSRTTARWGPRAALSVLLLPLLLAAVLSCLPGRALAHAEIEGSVPAAGAVLAAPPRSVTLVFGESVEVRDGAIEVYDAQGARADVGPLSAVGPGHAGLRVALRPGLPPGTFTVRWHVSASDTHPVTGSFRFSVGAPSSSIRPVPGGRNDLAGLVLGLLRWAGYLGLVLGPGLLLNALWLWPAGLLDRRTRRMALSGLALLAASTLGGMALQGVWASGDAISALWSAPATLDTHSHRFDVVYAVRGYVLVVFAVALIAALSSSSRAPAPPRRLLLGAAVASTVALEATWPPVGHSASGSWAAVTLTANLAHTLAMSVWLGGLLLVLVGLGRDGAAVGLSGALPRFSRLALAAVATLVATGTVLAVGEVGSLHALTSTTFGRVLLTKLTGVAVLLLLGDAARRWVRRHLADATGAAASPTPAAQVSGLRLGMAAEVGVAAAVLALTAALVVVVPARQDSGRRSPPRLAPAGAVVPGPAAPR